jgi:hypothetical protein
MDLGDVEWTGPLQPFELSVPAQRVLVVRELMQYIINIPLKMRRDQADVSKQQKPISSKRNPRASSSRKAQEW